MRQALALAGPYEFCSLLLQLPGPLCPRAVTGCFYKLGSLLWVGIIRALLVGLYIRAALFFWKFSNMHIILASGAKVYKWHLLWPLWSPRVVLLGRTSSNVELRRDRVSYVILLMLEILHDPCCTMLYTTDTAIVLSVSVFEVMQDFYHQPSLLYTVGLRMSPEPSDFKEARGVRKILPHSAGRSWGLTELLLCSAAIVAFNLLGS